MYVCGICGTEMPNVYHCPKCDNSPPSVIVTSGKTKRGTVRGKLRTLEDDEIKDVVLAYRIYPSEYFVGQHELRLIGGPSGFEGFVIDKNLDNMIKMTRNGWRACVGTIEGYDELIIEEGEMQKVLEVYKKLKGVK